MSDAPHRYNADKALKSPGDDLFGRSDFAKRIARDIGTWRKTGDSLVVSLSGDWGSGKTTLAHFILHYLRADTPPDKAAPMIAHFNPWQWEGQQMLFDAFFGEIAASLDRENPGERAKGLATAWRGLGRFFGVTKNLAKWGKTGAAGLTVPATLANPVVGGTVAITAVVGAAVEEGAAAVEELANNAADAHENQEGKSLEEVRGDIAATLTTQATPLVIVIDDIDRLSRSQVQMLMQLIKANADLPNVVYLLLYQRDVVAKALDEMTGDKGAAFLRKIVQVELDVPTPPQHQIQKLLKEGIRKTWSRAIYEWNTTRRDRWEQLFDDAVCPFFTTPRDIKRFLSVFDFTFDGHIRDGHLEVNETDLVLVETLRIFDPGAYQEIQDVFRRDRNILLELLYDDKESKNEFALSVDNLIEKRELTERQKRRLTELLNGLFPQIKGRHGSHGDGEWSRDLRVCSYQHFHRYFDLQYESDQVPAAFMAKFLRATSRGECVAAFREALVSGFYHDLMSRCRAHRPNFTLAQIQLVVGAIMDLSDELPEGLVSEGEFKSDGLRNFIFLAKDLILGIDNGDQRCTAYLSAVTDTNAINGPLLLVCCFDADNRSHGDQMGATPRSVNERAIAVLMERLRQAFEAKSIWKTPFIRAALGFYQRNGDGAQLKAWIADAIEDGKVACALLMGMLSETVSGGLHTFKIPVGSLLKLVDLPPLAKAASEGATTEVEKVVVGKLLGVAASSPESLADKEVVAVTVNDAGNIIETPDIHRI